MLVSRNVLVNPFPTRISTLQPSQPVDPWEPAGAAAGASNSSLAQPFKLQDGPNEPVLDSTWKVGNTPINGLIMSRLHGFPPGSGFNNLTGVIIPIWP